YGPFAKKHPFAFMLLEQSLRDYELKRLSNIRKNLSLLKTRSPLIRILVLIKCFILKIDSREKSLLLLPKRFNFFEKLVIASLTMKSIKHRTTPISYIIFKDKNLNKIIDKILSQDLYCALSDQELINQLDEITMKMLSSTKKILTLLNVKHIIASAEMQGMHRLMIEAAKQMDIKFTVLLHGYIQDPYLVAIAPSQADTVIAWTKQQEEELKPFLEKINYIGFPFKIKNKSDRMKKNVLVVLEPLELFKENVFHLIRQIKSSYPDKKIIIRLHPKDRENQQILKLFKDNKIDLSSRPLEKELQECFLTIGTNSSTLIQSHFLGIPTLQIKEYAKFNFEGVSQVNLEDISNFDALNTRPHDLIDRSRLKSLLSS
ncbi:MAG: hypothetical protein WDA09_04860, partial [Bacteriovoracaceae bacterium]